MRVGLLSLIQTKRSCHVRIKPALHLNTNRMRTQHAKMKQLFNIDLLPRRGKQQSAVRRMFGKQPNTSAIDF